jgi:hypothetical protein
MHAPLGTPCAMEGIAALVFFGTLALFCFLFFVFCSLFFVLCFLFFVRHFGTSALRNFGKLSASQAQ